VRGKSFIWWLFHKGLEYGGDSVVHVGLILKGKGTGTVG